jgi:uroporphyrinogen decarboxylase
MTAAVSDMDHSTRVFAALERREVDRVPLFEVVVDPAVYKALLPDSDYLDFNDWIGLDVVSLNRSSWDLENVEYIDEDKRLFKDRWGVIRGIGPEQVPYPVKGPIESMEDLKNYAPPDPEDPSLLDGLDELVDRYKGKKPIVWIGRDAFFNPAFLRGIESYLMDYILNPELVHALVELCQAFDLRVTERAIEAGVDIVVLGDDYADKNGPMMSPEHFRRFILPGLKRAIKSAREAGACVIKHTDGNIWPILDDILEAAPDGINPLEPAAGMDIGRVKDYCGDRVAIIGNIDCGELLSRRSEEEVRETVKRTIQTAAPGGGYLMSSSNSIHSSVKPENYKAMVDTLMEFGRYPI